MKESDGKRTSKKARSQKEVKKVDSVLVYIVAYIFVF